MSFIVGQYTERQQSCTTFAFHFSGSKRINGFNVGLKSLLHQSLSGPEVYGHLVFKFKKIMGRTDFTDQFQKIIIRHKRISYDLNVMRQSACLVINPMTVDKFAALLN